MCHVFLNASLDDTKKYLQNLNNTTGFEKEYSLLCDAIQNLFILAQKAILKTFAVRLKDLDVFQKTEAFEEEFEDAFPNGYKPEDQPEDSANDTENR